MQVSKEKGAQVAAELQAAAKEILERHGLADLKIKWAYGEWFKFSVEASAVEITNGVNAASKEAQYYAKFGWTAYGPNFEATPLTAPLGTVFTVNGRTMRFAGVEPKRKKYPIVVIDTSTNETAYMTEAVIARINQAAN